MEAIQNELDIANADYFETSLMATNISVSILDISTMTINVMTDTPFKHSSFNSELLAKLNSLNSYSRFSISSVDGVKSCAFSNAIAVKKQLIHQIKATTKTPRQLNALLFTNGKISFSGCRDLNEARDFLTDICSTLNEPRNTSDWQIRLMVSHFSIDKHIKIDKLHEELINEVQVVESVPKQEKLKVKFSCSDGKGITIIAFPSGKINVTGAVKGSQLAEAHGFMSKFIDSRSDKVCMDIVERVNVDERPKKRGRKSKSAIEEMYEDLVGLI